MEKFVLWMFLLLEMVKKIKTNCYQKPTCYERILNFYSHNPFKYETNVIKHLVERAILLA